MVDFSKIFQDGPPIPEALPADELNDRERALRDKFVFEYLYDYSPTKAAQRCGFQFQFALEYGRKFMEEPYVQMRIAELKQSQKFDNKEGLEYNKARVVQALMAEAHNYGFGSSHAARVSALKQLAFLYAMEPAKEVKTTVTHKGGVMAIPGIARLDDWEQAASASQDALADHARNS